MVGAYDYVIVGAGSAGCVLAARLTEDPATRVLLIEGGKSDRSHLFRKPGMLVLVIEVPKIKARSDWGYRTAPLAFMDRREMPWQRGKVLGGCSSVNGMLYIRGHRDNYDGWRDLGNPGWGYADVLPYFKKSEGHEDGESEFHGGSGPLKVSRQRGCSPVSEAFPHAVAEVMKVPADADFNGARQEGAGLFQMTCAGGVRQSTSVAFLDPALGRSNLTVVTGALVTGITVDNGRAIAVNYTQGDGQRIAARADREVVLAAGSIGSPQLLMLSGIGPAEHLRALGIPVVQDLSGVGRNLHDHLMVPLRYVSTRAVGHSSSALHYLGGMIRSYVLGGGWFDKTFLEGGAFIKSDPSKPRPDIQMHTVPWAYPEPNDDGPKKAMPSKDWSFSMLPSLIYPKSRGELRLRSTNPADAPLLDPRYFEEDDDMKLLLRGIELSREFARTKPLADFFIREATPGPSVTDDAALRAFVRLHAKTVYHPVGTCRMGPDAGAVVDAELRVHGVDGLRVIDASVMPHIPGGNTNAPTIMIAEKGADLLKAAAARA